MKISVIAAVAENNAIGRENDLLCHLPADLRHFKTLTTGHPVIMGRNTYESLPNGALPDRRNIVVSRTMETSEEKRIEVASSLEEAVAMCEGENETFVIGGAQIYRSAVEMADTLYVTWIHHTFADADAFFPEIELPEWVEVSRERHTADGKNPFDYSFVEYRRK